MSTDLDHFTSAKRQELARMVSILFDEFGRALAGRKTPHAKSARILKVVLLGSYELSPWLPRALSYRYRLAVTDVEDLKRESIIRLDADPTITDAADVPQVNLWCYGRRADGAASR